MLAPELIRQSSVDHELDERPVAKLAVVLYYLPRRPAQQAPPQRTCTPPRQQEDPI